MEIRFVVDHEVGGFSCCKNLKQEIMHSRSEVHFQLRVSIQVTLLGNQTADTAFGPLAIIDHAVMKKGLTIKMHEHVNDEILSYISSGVMHHKDSAGFEAPIAREENFNDDERGSKLLASREGNGGRG